MQAVAEAWRNLTAVGARPLAITDNMNFGNPERPEIMGQLVGCIQGMAEAAELLLILTDVDAVYRDWGKPTQKAIERITVDEAERLDAVRHAWRSWRLGGSLLPIVAHFAEVSQ